MKALTRICFNSSMISKCLETAFIGCLCSNRAHFSINPDSKAKHSNTDTNTKIEINYNAIKGVKSGDSSHYVIQFTCKVCQHRTTRMFTKLAYHKGVVLIRCEGCEGIHLIADNLGWFEDENVNVEDILKKKGEAYIKLTMDGIYQLEDSDSKSKFKLEDRFDLNRKI